MLACSSRRSRADDDEGPFTSDFAGLSFRELGPALTSGRIIDIAVDPTDKFHWIVGVASGGVWKTVNAGTTWTPVFDSEGSVLDRLRDLRPE